MYFNKWSHHSQKHFFLWTSMATKDYDNQTWQDTPRKWAGKENKWSKNHIHVTENSKVLKFCNSFLLQQDYIPGCDSKVHFLITQQVQFVLPYTHGYRVILQSIVDPPESTTLKNWLSLPKSHPALGSSFLSCAGMLPGLFLGRQAQPLWVKECSWSCHI